jgi:hypothetical protein
LFSRNAFTLPESILVARCQHAAENSKCAALPLTSNFRNSSRFPARRSPEAISACNQR